MERKRSISPVERRVQNEEYKEYRKEYRDEEYREKSTGTDETVPKWRGT
jgi:hypothetical protein